MLISVISSSILPNFMIMGKQHAQIVLKFSKIKSIILYCMIWIISK